MTKKNEIFAAANDAIAANRAEKARPLSAHELKDLTDNALTTGVQSLANPVKFLGDNFDMNDPKLRSAVQDLVFMVTKAEYQKITSSVQVRQYADNFETVMIDLVGRMTAKLTHCGNVGKQMTETLERALQNPRSEIRTIAVCIAQTPAIVGRYLSAGDRSQMTEIAKPFADAMAQGLAEIVTAEAGVSLKAPDGPTKRYIATKIGGDDLGYENEIRFVYDAVDKEVIFMQECWDGRWGDLDSIDPDMLRNWITDNLQSSTPAQMDWSSTDETPEWAQKSFLIYGRGSD
jgi:hypothetical protein